MNERNLKHVDQLTNSLLQVAKSKSGDALLLVSIEQVLQSAKPRQALILRRCAVARWFDTSVLAVLRENDEGNERVLELMRDYSFVRELGDGRLAYHDQVRSTLLAEWQRTDPNELHTLHRRLAQYFGQRSTPPGSLRRSRQIREGIDMTAVPLSAQSDMWRREAIYHMLCAEPARGLSELRTAFEDFEESYRIADAEALLQVASESPQSRSIAQWLSYLRARTQRVHLNLSAATSMLEDLLDQSDLGPELTAEVQRSLGEVRAETGQWALATDLYHRSLACFRETKNQRAVAETMLLLGEAYQGLGVSTGSWHVSSPPPNTLARVWQHFSVGLLGLPFWLIALVLGPKHRWLPLPHHCARYQNWLLIRLYNTARRWYLRTRDAFHALGDERGVLRAEQRLADILLLYGYHSEARTQIDTLLEQPAAQDMYRRAWLQRSLAEAELAAGNVAGAQQLLDSALGVFRSLGDVRREASIRALQGRASTKAGDMDGALDSYQSSLERFRMLRYATARERILHDLRIWERQPITPELRQRVAATIAAEPEKRYVGRFIQRYLPLLQVASMLAWPLALLALAFFAPRTDIKALAGGVFTFDTFYDPMRAVTVLGTLAVFYALSYTLLALSVIFFLPIGRIEREQPDIIVTSLSGIARYNRRGQRVQSMPWVNIRNWLSLDRRIWKRPLKLYSRTFLEDAKGEDLRIDGITGWYDDLQEDIGQRFAASEVHVERTDLGYNLLRSTGGLSAVLGGVVLLIVTLVENQVVPLPALLPVQVYAVFSMIALSGVLLLVPAAYWLAHRPLKLQRTLQLNDRLPYIIAVVGAFPIMVYLLSNGQALPVPILNISTFIWGIYMLTEAILTVSIPNRAVLRRIIIISMLVLGLLAMRQPMLACYNRVVGTSIDAQLEQSDDAPMSATRAEAGIVAGERARAAGADPYDTYLVEGSIAFQVGDYQKAIASFQGAVDQAKSDSPHQALAYYNLAQAYVKSGDLEAAWPRYQRYVQLCTSASGAENAICRELSQQGTLSDAFDPEWHSQNDPTEDDANE